MARHLFTSESVTEGHPDKMADQISDAILDSMLRDDPRSRVAVETLITTGQVHVAGEVTTETYVDIPTIIREKILEIGYDSSAKGYDGASCGVSVSIGAQSPDIARGVMDAFEYREGEGSSELDRQGAGDQGLMFGYACRETPELMPLPIMLAHRLARGLSEVRRSGDVPYLRPDGKTQVTIEYVKDEPVRLDTVVVSAQHAPDIDLKELLAPDVRDHVVQPVLAGLELDTTGYRLLVNPTGRFEIGGPMGDAGLTGRKIIIDTYGGMARHGGGAFSGKDPSKVDRSAAYAMRWVAKNVVAAGLADRCEAQVAYAIGKANPVGLFVECFGTENVDVARIQDAVLEVFDLRPAAIVGPRPARPICTQTSLRSLRPGGPDFSWERTDRVDELRSAACGSDPGRRDVVPGARSGSWRESDGSGGTGRGSATGRGMLGRPLPRREPGVGSWPGPRRRGPAAQRRQRNCRWPRCWSMCRWPSTAPSATSCRSGWRNGVARLPIPGAVRGPTHEQLLLRRVATSDHQGRLALLERVVSPERVLTPEIAALAREVADRYAGTVADVLRLAIPPRHAGAEARPGGSGTQGGPGSRDEPGFGGPRLTRPRAGPWARYPAGEAFRRRW